MKGETLAQYGYRKGFAQGVTEVVADSEPAPDLLTGNDPYAKGYRAGRRSKVAQHQPASLATLKKAFTTGQQMGRNTDKTAE